MKALLKATREDVYNAPIIPWNNGTYTPLPNSTIMDLMDTKIHDLGLTIKSESYKVSATKEGLIKGVIGSYNLMTDNGEFGQRVMFRNSYDKSMSFAMVTGLNCWICENGCIAGEYQYKRVHRGAFDDVMSTTERDVIANIDGGFNLLQQSYEHNVEQMEELKQIEVSPEAVYQILGVLFLTKNVLTVSQMSIVKRELEVSKNFRHLGDKDFTAFDLYNHVTESLKVSHPLTYFSDHIETHTLFEETFKI